MAWFRNHYQCYRCDEAWADEWSCEVDDECPHCGARDACPVDSEDLTFIIENERTCFVVYRSSDEAEYDAAYRETIRFLSKELAEAYVRAEPAERLI